MLFLTRIRNNIYNVNIRTYCYCTNQIRVSERNIDFKFWRFIVITIIVHIILFDRHNVIVVIYATVYVECLNISYTNFDGNE